MLDGSGSEGSMRSWISHTIRGRVRGPKWLVTASVCALLVLSFYHWSSLRRHGRYASTFVARPRDVSELAGDSLNTRLELLGQTARGRAERTRSPNEEVQPSESDGEDDVVQTFLVDSSGDSQSGQVGSCFVQ